MSNITKLTHPAIGKLAPGRHKIDVPDLYLDVGKKARTFWVAKSARGETHWRKLGRYEPGMDLPAVRRAAREAVREIERGEQKPAIVTLGEWVEQHLATASLSSGSVKTYRITIARAGKLLAKPLADIKPADVQAIHKRLSDTYSARTANLFLKVFRAFYNAALANDITDAPNPARRIRMAKTERAGKYLNPEQIERLKAALNAEPPQVAGALRFIMLTGVRHKEALNLEFAHVDFATSTARLHKAKTGEAFIPLSPQALQIIRQQPRFIGDDRVFRIASLTYSWGRVRAKAGLEGFRIHDLRHTFASLLIEDGVGMSTVGRLLNHARASSTTELYIHHSDQHLRDAVEKTGRRLAD